MEGRLLARARAQQEALRTAHRAEEDRRRREVSEKIPEIGSIKLNKLSGRQVQTMYNNVRDHGRMKKGPNDKRDSSLSASYIRSLHRMLHMALERAVKEQLILRNPCNDVILPREEKREMKTKLYLSCLLILMIFGRSMTALD